MCFHPESINLYLYLFSALSGYIFFLLIVNTFILILRIEMYVEDKVSHRGPFPIDVVETQTVAELKRQIARDFEIPEEVQRWILGKELVEDDTSTLKDHQVAPGCAVFLYLVAPGG